MRLFPHPKGITPGGLKKPPAQSAAPFVKGGNFASSEQALICKRGGGKIYSGQ